MPRQLITRTVFATAPFSLSAIVRSIAAHVLVAHTPPPPPLPPSSLLTSLSETSSFLPSQSISGATFFPGASSLSHRTESSPILSALSHRPSLSALIPSQHQHSGGVRCVTYGAEYQPSQRKRKRKHGFLARLKKQKKLLKARRKKGRRFLSH